MRCRFPKFPGIAGVRVGAETLKGWPRLRWPRSARLSGDVVKQCRSIKVVRKILAAGNRAPRSFWKLPLFFTKAAPTTGSWMWPLLPQADKPPRAMEAGARPLPRKMTRLSRDPVRAGRAENSKVPGSRLRQEQLPGIQHRSGTWQAGLRTSDCWFGKPYHRPPRRGKLAGRHLKSFSRRLLTNHVRILSGARILVFGTRVQAASFISSLVALALEQSLTVYR